MSKTLAIFGGSFNPPGQHHRAIAEALARAFDETVIVPCGPRPDKPITNDVQPIHRAAMVDLTFRGMPRVRVELFDLEASSFTRTHELDARFAAEGEVWHVVGADLIAGGGDGRSQIHASWERGPELWSRARFAVLHRPGYPMREADLPPNHRVIEISHEGSSSEIRNKVFRHQSIDGEVTSDVYRYIQRHNLYRGYPARRAIPYRLEEERVFVYHDEQNPQARELAAGFKNLDAISPTLIIVIGGDGTMLRAIRQLWRLRAPFYGVNAGHLGFLLNKAAPASFSECELSVQHLALLRVETDLADGRTTDALAFNDAWVERAAGQTAWIKISVNDQVRVDHMVADGALISTAAGSTSYARAMGASALPLNTPALLLVGSNVLKPLFWRPVVLPMDSRVELTNLEPGKRPWRAFIDGVPQGTAVALRARASNIAAVEMAFDPNMDPAEKLARIQFPPSGLAQNE